MCDNISLRCDECKELFEVEMGIGMSMLAFNEESGDPILCGVCFPEEPYSEEEESSELQ